MMKAKQNQIAHEDTDFSHNRQNDPLFKAARASVEDSKSLLLLSSAMSKAIKAKYNAQEITMRSTKNDEDNRSITSNETSSSQLHDTKALTNPLQHLFSRRHHHRHPLSIENSKPEMAPFPSASASTPTMKSKSKSISRRLVNFLPIKSSHSKYSSSAMSTDASATTTPMSSSSKNKRVFLSQKSLEFEALLEEYPTRTIKTSLTPCTAA
ncbi:hypothetical protein BDF20DRAFT_895894 [Mycotypha africana]|uniref:uncharacterized protein n=1 Tax=Mycotypha africana TaxID=64632 RepID=UPI0023008C10|nr:uncharacterized protein BDF20DRAFT_895894 [Mycotypha africana]KAI8968353.1 hypothetical protein BDF20DRAFT_895894 [Mycotypha africana]